MGKSLREFCTENGRDTLLREWDAARNGGLTPSDVSFGSHQKVWWQCSKGHSWQAKVYSRSAGSGCPYCTGRKEVPENSLAVQVPSLEAEWDAEKNAPLKFADLTIGSHKKVWWRCPKGHSYRAAISSRAGGGTGCPFCAGQKVIQGENDLATQYPQLAAQWDAAKNGTLTPELVTSGSNRRVVALRKGTFLSGCYSSPRAEWKRLSVLLQPQGSARLQRPRDDRAGRCLAMAPDAQRQPYTAAGDARQPPQGLVALR